MAQIGFAVLVIAALLASVISASAWNIPGHMLTGAIAYQVLSQENLRIIEKVKVVLEKHPWYANQWQARLEDVTVADREMVLFMQAARWAMIFAFRTKLKIDRVGITSTFHSNPRANRRPYRSQSPTQ
ncbi:MAG TPA: hypothetical protein VI585_06170 [Candidatus Binatia bacterium]